MGQFSNIEWTHHTFNPVRGCSKVSAGCANCYAETLSYRNPGLLGVWGDKGTRVVASEAMWRQPLKWDRAAKQAGERHRVFCASLSDVFEDRPEWLLSRMRLFKLIHETPNLDWLLLTKRPENISRLVRQVGCAFAPSSDDRKAITQWMHYQAPPANVWLGTSVENQATADERTPHLLKAPASVRFLSMEPLLGPVDLGVWLNPECSHCEARSWTDNDCGSWYCASCESARPRILDWVIVGGESGHGARPMHPEWVRSIRDQCQAANVPFLFKQWGEHAPLDQVPGLFERRTTPKVGRVLRWPFGLDEPGIARVGKKAAGRLLDGRTWDEFPVLHHSL